MQRRQSQLAIGFDPLWRRQPAWDVPNSMANLSAAFPATSRNYVTLDETTEDIMDCTGQELLLELLTGRIARLTLDFDGDPNIIAGLTAGAFGVAAAPAGGTSETQTLTITATGGTFSLTVSVGANSQTTAPLPFNATSADIEAAIAALSNVGPGDITVAGDGPHVFTFGADLGSQDVQLITVNTFGLTGGTGTNVVTVSGVGRTHPISRLSGFTLPYFTFYVGFRDSDEQPVIFKNAVVDSLRVRSSSRTRVSGSVTLVGSGELEQAVGYNMPPCYDPLPLRFGDCQMNIAGTDYIAANLAREFEVGYDNGVVGQYDGQGVDVTRLERADVRPAYMNMFVLGEPGDNLFNLASAKTKLPASTRIGPVGRHVLYSIPSGIIRLTPERIRFGGDPPESELAITVRPTKISGDATTPINATAVIGQSTALLTPAA